MKILNKKEIKEIESKIEEIYDAKNSLEGFTIMTTGKKEKIWITNRDVFKIDLEKLRINSIGLYFGRIDSGKIKLSVEGSIIVGAKAKNGIIKINEEQLWDFIRGFDINLLNPGENKRDYVLVKYEKNWIGIGKIDDGILKNALPKSRKIQSLTKQ